VHRSFGSDVHVVLVLVEMVRVGGVVGMVCSVIMLDVNSVYLLVEFCFA
jgi:hypothetical protein